MKPPSNGVRPTFLIFMPFSWLVHHAVKIQLTKWATFISIRRDSNWKNVFEVSTHPFALTGQSKYFRLLYSEMTKNNLKNIILSVMYQQVGRLTNIFSSVAQGGSVTRHGEISPLWLFLKFFGNFSSGFVLCWAQLRAQIDSFSCFGLIFNVGNGHILKKIV